MRNYGWVRAVNTRLLLSFYILVLLLPLGLSWSFGWPPRPVHQEIAAGLGMLAYSIILTEFVLSGRFRSISSGTGMDVTMRVHQLMARTALIFALVHPLFYQGTPSGGPRPWDVTRQLTLTTDFSTLSTGIAAYLLLFAFVFAAIGRNALGWKYETWRLAHGLGAVLIAGLLLHHTVYSGRYAAHPVMAGLWVAMTLIAAGSVLYVYLIAPLRQKRRPWRVASVQRLTPRQWEVRIAPDGHAGLDFEAGQFVWLNLGHSAFSLWENPFSISSAPKGGPALAFVIKEIGDFTSALDRVETGTVAYVDGPHGSLTVAGRDEPGIVLVAGGVGIAPMLSILRQCRATGDRRAIKVIYGNRAEEQIVYRNELSKEDLVLVLSEPPPDWTGETGLIDGPLLDRVLTDREVRDCLFVLCGPAAMMDAAETYLIAKGTPSHRILSERFDYD